MANFLKKNLTRIYFTAKVKLQQHIFNNATEDNIYADLYYCFFNRSFRRQHFSTLSGIRKFYRKGILNNAILIRNLHRIEKGLIMPVKKEVFARDFIYETVNCFEKLHLHLKKENREFFAYGWDILNAYFDCADLDDVEVKKAFEIFKNIHGHSNEVLKTPVFRKELQISEVTYQQFVSLSVQRRSIRFFNQIKVPRSLIEKAVKAALYSPSACNRQPFRVIVADDNNLKNDLGSLAPGAAGYYRDVPVFLAIIGDLSNYFSERDKNLIYIDSSLFAMSFMYALETLGLSSCPTNWPDIEENEKKLAKLLELEKHERCIMLIGLGYAKEDSLVPYSQKKSTDLVVKYL